MHRDAFTPSELALLSRVFARSKIKNETATEGTARITHSGLLPGGNHG